MSSPSSTSIEINKLLNHHFFSIKNGFNVVAMKVEDGERFEKEFSRFIKKLQEIEETYSNSLLKLVKSLDINTEIG
jgi:hypothetical protein